MTCLGGTPLNFLLLTQDTGAILGPIAKLLGFLLNALFNMLNAVGIPNIGLAIILFTVFVNILMIPLTYSSQKNMKLNSVIQPEMQKITAKYKGKRDQASLEKQQQEQQLLYARYGYNPTSGCLPLLIQMPILFALYRVLYRIPGYVTLIKEQFTSIVTLMQSQTGYESTVAKLAETLGDTAPDTSSVNAVIDWLYGFNSSDWSAFQSAFSGIWDQVSPFVDKVASYNSFLFGINLAEAPGFRLTPALIIPVLAWLSQYLSIKVSSNNQNTDPADTTAQTMKTMNLTMPLMSAFFCISLPAGLGVYWVASAVARTIVMVILNKHFDNVGEEQIIADSIAKQNVKRKKQGLPEINPDGTYVHSGKKIDAKTESANKGMMSRMMNAQAQAQEADKASHTKNMPANGKYTGDSSKYYEKTYQKGSIADKARAVQKYNNKDKK